MVMDDDREGVSLPSGPDAKKRRVSYFYEPSIGEYNYGQEHPMKPHRIRMTHNLIEQYKLDRRMEINRPFPAGPADIRQFHSQEYVDFLASVTPVTLTDPAFSRHRKRFNVCDDCPVFDGLFGFCQASAGGSIGAAAKLNRGDADIAINWAGGLHHAKRAEASGFCYVNDIVLGILELLKVHRRVLYVDIDVHHGDGVEEAFYATDRVMTVSFHKFGDFFPGTGQIKDTGSGIGKNYALNVPLNDGMDDKSFRGLFRPIIQKVMEVYQPEAVALQCGADSLSGDRLGCFNLSVKGHADCLHFLRSFNAPLMVLGGGGYTVPNVARCWCYETAVAVGGEPHNNLPDNEYYEHFGPDYTLHVEPCNMKNLNSLKDMEKIRNTLLEQLSRLPHVPSVPFQTTPPITQVPEEAEESMDQRPKPRIWNDMSDLDQPSTQPHFKRAKPLWKVEGSSHEVKFLVKFLESLEVNVPSVSRNLSLSDELRSKMFEPTARPPGLHSLTAQALRAGTPQTSDTQVLGSAGISHPQTRISCPLDTQVPVTEVSDVPSMGASQPLGADHSEGEHLGSRPEVSDHSKGEHIGLRPEEFWRALFLRDPFVALNELTEGDPFAALKELIPEDCEERLKRLAQLRSTTTKRDQIPSAESLMKEFFDSIIHNALGFTVMLSELKKSRSTISKWEDALKDKEVELIVARKEVESERARAIRLEAMLGCVEKELTTSKTELVEARGKLKDARAELFECQIDREFVEVQLVSTLDDLEKELAKSEDLRHRLKASLTTLLDTFVMGFCPFYAGSAGNFTFVRYIYI